MSDSRSDQLAELLRLAKVRPLTQAESEILKTLLATDKGSAVIEYHLEKSYPKVSEQRRWTRAELAEIAADIDQKVAKRSRKQRMSRRFQQMAWTAAAVVCLFGVAYLWMFNRQPEFEPAIQFEVEPTKTPMPTPTLQSKHQYAELLNAPVSQSEEFAVADYSLTVAEALGQWDGNLYLPSQMPESWIFLGAVLHTDKANNPIVELGFIQESLGKKDLWILSQTLADGHPFNRPLPVVYQPLDDVNETNIYEDKLLTVGDLPAYGYQYEFVDRDKTLIEWTVYNTATWQQDEQLLTLTFVSNGNFPTNIVALTAEKLDMQLKISK